MARTHHVLQRILRRISTPQIPKRLPVRAFSTSIPRHTDAPTYKHGWAAYADTPEQEHALNSLWRDLHHGATPYRVWNSYSTLLQTMGARRLPARLHHWVLRKCTPDTDVHRTTLRQRLRAGRFAGPMHEHEDRLQAVIHNMRADGHEPARTDYNFVLQQFASVGYVDGVVAVYKDMLVAAARVAGVSPDHRTFGNLFYALAYRHTLPMHPEQRQDLVAHMQTLFNGFLADMQAKQVDMTEANMDIVMRILKATLDTEAIEGLLRWSYGIDLRHPDKLALEYSSPSSSSSSPTPAPQRVPFAFTTTSLNTTLELIGRTGNVSRLVQAFEVLTTPLPAPPPVDALEADEDDDWGVPGPSTSTSTPTIPLPCAQPNTTSYAILLRYICRENHAILARHYLLQAMDLHRRTAGALSVAVNSAVHSWNLALEGVAAPHFALNRRMVFSVLGLANRDKKMSMLRWLKRKMPGVVRQQTQELEFYRRIGAVIREREQARRMRLEKAQEERKQRSKDEQEQENASDTSDPAPTETHGRRKRVRLQDVDVRAATPLPLATTTPSLPTHASSPAPTASPSHVSPFSLATHTAILARNVAELSALGARVDFLLARSAQRHKERIGRRVWKGRDVYFVTPPAGAVRRDGSRVPAFFDAKESKSKPTPRAHPGSSARADAEAAEEARLVDTYAARLRQAPFRPQRVHITKDAWQGLVGFRALAPEHEAMAMLPSRAKGPVFGPRARREREKRAEARRARAGGVDAEGIAKDAVLRKGTGGGLDRASGAGGVRSFSTSAAVGAVSWRDIGVPSMSIARAPPMSRWISSSLSPTTPRQAPPQPQPTFLDAFSLTRLLSPLLSAWFSSSRS